MKRILTFLILTSILVSCGTSNNVVNNGLFQKRKHTSGWFVKKNKKYQEKSTQEKNLAFEETKQKENASVKKEDVNPEIKSTESAVPVDNKKVQATSNSHEDKKGVKTRTESKKGKQRIKKAVSKDKSEHQSSTAVESFGKEDIKSEKKSVNNSRNSSSGLRLILLILLAIIIPPVAVFIVQGGTTLFVIDLILFIIGWSSFWFFNLGGLAALAAVVIALLVLFGVI